MRSNSVLSHNPGYAMYAAGFADLSQVTEDTTAPVDTLAGLEGLPDQNEQAPIFLMTFRLGMDAPCIEATSGNAQ